MLYSHVFDLDVPEATTALAPPIHHVSLVNDDNDDNNATSQENSARILHNRARSIATRILVGSWIMAGGAVLFLLMIALHNEASTFPSVWSSSSSTTSASSTTLLFWSKANVMNMELSLLDVSKPLAADEDDSLLSTLEEMDDILDGQPQEEEEEKEEEREASQAEPEGHTTQEQGEAQEEKQAGEEEEEDDWVIRMRHKSLWPLSSADIMGMLLATAGLLLAAGGGIGGGGILVPIYCLVMHFSPKHAIPLSNVTVFGGAVANLVLNHRKRHPAMDRPCTDWDLILVMEPLTIAGAIVGALINKVLPELLLVILLVLLLSFTAHTTLCKAFSLYHAETKQLQQQASSRRELQTRNDSSQDSSQASSSVEANEFTKLLTRTTSSSSTTIATSLSDSCASEEWSCREAVKSLSPQHQQQQVKNKENTGNYRSTSTNTNTITTVKQHSHQSKAILAPLRATKNGVVVDIQSRLEKKADVEAPAVVISYHHVHNRNDSPQPQQPSDELARILEQERHVPVENVRLMIVLFVVVLAMNVLKGGGAFPSPLHITCGSSSFWIAHGVLLLWIAIVAWYGRRVLLRKHYAKLACRDYVYAPNDIQWDERNTIVYPMLCGVSGFFAGMFGIGGGIVKGPLMLAMGVHPAVSSATAACMILFTSFTSTTSFWVFGLLVPDYALVCLMLGFVTTLLGQLCMTYVMQRAGGRHSYIAFSIGAVVLVSAILMTFESLSSWAAGVQDHSHHHHAGGICGTGDHTE